MPSCWVTRLVLLVGAISVGLAIVYLMGDLRWIWWVLGAVLFSGEILWVEVRLMGGWRESTSGAPASGGEA